MKENVEVRPHATPWESARCGAQTRRGTPCQAPAMKNQRCRLHGGKSTGPRTAAGIERIRLALTKHGRYSQAARVERAQFRALIFNARETLRGLEGLPGNGSNQGRQAFLSVSAHLC